MVHYDQCPVCSSKAIQYFLEAKDHTVSGDRFSIWRCIDCTAMFTQDVPAQDTISAYYASENYISHSDTQEGLVNKLYHIIRKLTLVSKKRLVRRETGKRSGNILDVGCGTGAFLYSMRRAGWKVTGLEPDAAARARAKQLYKIESFPSPELYHLSDGAYDAVTLWHVLEHVHELHAYIGQLKKLLAHNGRLFVAVPNYTSHDAELYKEYWAAYDVPRHLYHFSPQSMEKLMDMHNLKVKKIKAMWFDSFYVSMLSEQYRNGRGNMVKAFFTGLVSNLKAVSDTKRCSSVIYVISRS